MCEGVTSYVEEKLTSGVSVSTMLQSFAIDDAWLQSWLIDHNDGREDLEELTVGNCTDMISSWVNHKRGQEEREALCHAAIAGDVSEVQRLLILSKDGSRECSWDAEDRFGITAGEYALYLGRNEVFEVLLASGVREVVDRFRCELNRSFTLRRPEGYLLGRAEYGENGCLLDRNRMPVMMPWEKQLMDAHAEHFNGTDFLNVGFGCGIIDASVQKIVAPRRHVICEAHPTVLAEIEAQGWMSKQGVEIWHGKWQIEVAKNLAEGACFQTVFYDTHDEGVREFLEFAQLSSTLLDEKRDGPLLFSYFNGMEFNNIFRHAVYCRAVETYLTTEKYYESVEFIRIPLKFEQDAWRVWESKVKYFHLKTYFLPLCWKRRKKTQTSATIANTVMFTKDDMSDWMKEGIARGLSFHRSKRGFAEGPVRRDRSSGYGSPSVIGTATTDSRLSSNDHEHKKAKRQNE